MHDQRNKTRVIDRRRSVPIESARSARGRSAGRLLALSLLVSILSSSCLIGSETKVTQEGRRISQVTLDRVEVGNSTDFVRELLGQPTSRTPLEGDRQIWKWRYRTVKRTEGGFFLLISSESTTEESGAVFVEFQDGLVVRTWRD